MFSLFGQNGTSRSCGNKNSNSSSQKSGKNRSDKTIEQTNQYSYLNVITIKKGEKIILDNPEKFIQIYILFSHEQKLWLNEINSNTNMSIDLEEYIANKRKKFYECFLRTANEYASFYSEEKNRKAVNEFLEQNPKFKKAYEDSTK